MDAAVNRKVRGSSEDRSGHGSGRIHATSQDITNSNARESGAPCRNNRNSTGLAPNKSSGASRIRSRAEGAARRRFVSDKDCLL